MRLEGGARGHGLGAERPARADEPFRQHWQRELRGEFAERHPRDAYERAVLTRQGERQFIGRGPGGAHDQHLVERMGPHVGPRGRKPRTRRRRHDAIEGQRRHGEPAVEDTRRL